MFFLFFSCCSCHEMLVETAKPAIDAQTFMQLYRPLGDVLKGI
jgi:CxxC motif-containing protein (DUF1111 family)